jgi:hypothetical protein
MLLDTTTRLARGLPERLGELIDRFKHWYEEQRTVITESSRGATLFNATEAGLDEALAEHGSYRLLRAGVWWDVLARDNWKCCACGRTSQGEAVRLEVDHIIPRSKGGTDDLSNLQTLCRKCNGGKSNRDSTDLRA